MNNVNAMPAGVHTCRAGLPPRDTRRRAHRTCLLVRCNKTVCAFDLAVFGGIEASAHGVMMQQYCMSARVPDLVCCIQRQQCHSTQP